MDDNANRQNYDLTEMLKLQDLWNSVQALQASGPPTSTPKRQSWVQEVLDGHPDRVRRELGVRKKVFEQLIRELSAQGLTGSKQATLEEQLGIFLYTCTTGLPCRRVGERTGRSTDMVKKYFCKMLHVFSAGPLYAKYVKLPPSDDPTPARIADDPNMHPFFKDAIGAIDGMHIACSPDTEKSAYRNRRGFYSQYCLVCCNFNLEFTCVVGGWEGRATDQEVYCEERTECLPIPAGKYYLADVAFPVCPQLLVPYSTQHHLPGWEREGMRPTNAHDYFNLRHAELKNVVERAICLLKERFRILTVAPEYEITDQAHIPSALFCIHNVVRCWDPKDIGGDEAAPLASTARSTDQSREAGGSTAKFGSVTVDEKETMVEKREQIASWLCKDRLCQYPRNRDHDVSM